MLVTFIICPSALPESILPQKPFTMDEHTLFLCSFDPSLHADEAMGSPMASGHTALSEAERLAFSLKNDRKGCSKMGLLALLVSTFFGTMVGGALAEAEFVPIPVSPLMSDRYVSGVQGHVDAKLREGAGFALEAVILGSRRYPSGGDFPTFVVLDRKGKHHRLAPADPRWKTNLSRKGKGKVVSYRAEGLTMEVVYLPERDRLNIVVRVRKEGNWRIIAVEGTLLRREVPKESEEYLVDGSGWLVFSDVPKRMERRWDANSDNLIGGATTAGFAGLREGDRIVFLKPLTFSHWLGWRAEPRGKTTRFELRSGLYFRPPRTKVFRTKLCHRALALRLETAEDMNGDGEVDWVDAGIAYRERYVKGHRKGCFRHRLRDAFRVYHQVFGYRSYKDAFRGLTKIDFADGIWWCKGVMAFAFPEDSESHPFAVRPNPKLDDIAPFKRLMEEAGQWVGIYYGHDYITLDAGDWPDEFIKRDPNGKPFRYFSPPPGSRYRPKFYKDNVRAVATGAMFRHYERILEVCRLKRGDPIMLDTFSAYARCGYHPDYPATPELEMQAKHRIAEFLHDEKGLIVAGEGLVEGLQDVVDYGAIAIVGPKRVKARFWERRNGTLQVPMLPVVFLGSGYYGGSWYEFRNPNPNWAVGLVYGVGYWDWLPQGPKFAWQRFARYYFNECLIWAQIADAKVVDVDQNGAQFTIRYDNGCTLWADVEHNRWWLEKGGVRYDGFTPFNHRGYMAVLKQGEFEIVIPGWHRLQISPHQPHRESIQFECILKEDRTILRGKFGHVKWRIPILHITPDGKERARPYDADPVLVKCLSRPDG